MLHHDVDYTPYEGMQVTGWPVTTLVRGERVWDDGEVCGRVGHGQFLPCGKPDMARPKVVDPTTGGHYVGNLPNALGKLVRRT